jgi:2-oxoglutarate/2-oxoacid ferredoxin oxidoreductase subunit alpha
MASVVVRIAGANGDGIESSGDLLMRVLNRAGMYVFGYRGYQSIIRGGHVWYQIRIGDRKLSSHGRGIDILVALNQESITNQMRHLNDNAVVIYDPSKVNVDSLDAKKYTLAKVPMLEIATKAGGSPVMRNVAAMGAVLGFIGMDMKILKDVLKHMFLRKGQAVVDMNEKIAEAGYGYEGVTNIYKLKGDGKPRYVLDGNTAIAFGAYAGGCKFYAAYPMTPASGIMHWFAAHENKGAFFKQTEDEIAAINMTIGAASAGARAMCGTSGGGFSLMVEALGLAGMLETPIVVVDSQRIGPSTGLPTKTEQGDLLFVMHASQGEFPRIVVAPRSVDECFTIGSEALNLAEKYQCPVLVLLDLYVSEHVETIDNFDFGAIKIERGKVAEKSAGTDRFKRYLLTEDGVSPRSFPGTPGLEFNATSYEHNEYGDLVSDVLSGLDEHIEMRKKMHEKRMKKIDTMLKDERVFVPDVMKENAKYHLVTFGSTTEPAIEAIELLNKKGLDFGLISFNYLFPLDEAKTKKMLSGKRLIDVECNFTAQLAKLIKMSTGIGIEEKILKYDGEAMTSEEIAEKAEEIAKRMK